jgi:replicative DNA helicase
MRIISGQTRLNHSNIRRGEYSPDHIKQIDKWVESVPRFGNNLRVDDRSTISTQQLRSVLEHAQKMWGTDIAFVDYSKFVTTHTKATGWEAEAEKLLSIKTTARELCMPIVVLGQLGRAAANRDDGRPSPQDWFGTDSGAQDNDILMLLWRPELYSPNKDTVKSMGQNVSIRGRACLIISQFRHGPTGELWFDWDEQMQRFTELDI